MGFVVGDCREVKGPEQLIGDNEVVDEEGKIQKVGKQQTERSSRQADRAETFLERSRKQLQDLTALLQGSVPLPPLPLPELKTTSPLLAVAPNGGFPVSLLLLR